jgi:hypothetical protein
LEAGGGMHSALGDHEVVRVDGGKLDADEDLVGAGSVGLGNVDILKTVDGVAKSCELNSTHIDISFVEAASSAWTGGNQRPWFIPCILPFLHPFLLYPCP